MKKATNTKKTGGVVTAQETFAQAVRRKKNERTEETEKARLAFKALFSDATAITTKTTVKK